MSELNFVYLTGAGASANALPITATFHQRLLDFYHAYKTSREDLEFQKGAHATEQLRHEPKLLKCVEWLIDQTERHASIDTYAKKLIVRGDRQKLLELKATLSVFFVIEQSRRLVDLRYDSFIASIVKYVPQRPATFPKNLKILTWNYDMQLEKAFYEYCPNEDLVIGQIALADNIVRINGVAGTIQSGHIGANYTSVLRPFTINTIIDTLDMFGKYIESPSEYQPDINFAWEQPDFYIERIVKPIASIANILVIIGYSFPFFNREIDRLILALMKNLSKIYVQLPQQSHHDIGERLNALSKNLPEITYIGDLDRFYIPYEF